MAFDRVHDFAVAALFALHVHRDDGMRRRHQQQDMKDQIRTMQPTLRHVPPKVLSFSTTATLRPSCAARIAHT